MTLKVGLIVGREWSFPPAFIEEVARRDQGVVAEYVKLGAPKMDEPCEYAVIIDRISHEVPFYRTFLKQAVLQGCTVVNNPFMWTADDKFFGAALATRLGIAHPKTVVLPNKEYIPGIVHEESLRNLQYPLDWQGIVEYVGLPCVLKDAHGGGWKDVYVCRSLEELIHHYDTSGLLTMVVQEFIEWDQFIRCICIGQDKVMPIKYDPRERKYHVEHDHLSPELGQRVVADSLKLVRALGYDMNSMEWAVRDGIPYAIDFMNPAPDMDVYSLTPHYFEWAVSAMSDMAIDLAKNPRRQVRDLRWDTMFTGSRHSAGSGGATTADAPADPSGGGHGSGSGGRAAGTSAVETGQVGSSSGRASTSDAATEPSGGQHGSGSGGRSADASAADTGQVGSSGRAATTAEDPGGQHGSGVGRAAATDAAKQLDATTQSGGPTAAQNQKIQELTFDAAEGEGGGYSGSVTEALEGTSPVSERAPGVYADESPAADLEPPAEVSEPARGLDAYGGASPADAGTETHGRSASSDAGTERAGEDTSPDAASRSAQEQA